VIITPKPPKGGLRNTIVIIVVENNIGKAINKVETIVNDRLKSPPWGI
jgi:hypothetical protein